ncbi:uncharacterized protein NEMAJ01_1547 [Nematocida major]|uniref:uncharacterized protein n=1 Tax=Nematocida major TaxID=1912982 RepID=UPI002007844A|nr:uncharacterized protein NEMAJ01_1547 [Nematocida major]KAH9386651.1 hypothetical protein NEMAJ01_1547 [Nematocida major]
MPKQNKTGRRWCFTMKASGVSMLEVFSKDPRVRYAVWHITKKEETRARGYVELKPPLKQTGMCKILGLESAACPARRPREEIIAEVSNSAGMFCGPFSYGQRELNKGGRPRRSKAPESKYIILSSYINT